MTIEDLVDDVLIPEDDSFEDEYSEDPYEDIDEYEVEEPVTLYQNDYDVVLEKGDKFKILSRVKESSNEFDNELVYHGNSYFILTKDDLKSVFSVFSNDLPSNLVVKFYGRGETHITATLFPKKIVVRGNTISIVSKMNSIPTGYFVINLADIVMISSVSFGKTIHLMSRPNVEISISVDDLDVGV